MNGNDRSAGATGAGGGRATASASASTRGACAAGARLSGTGATPTARVADAAPASAWPGGEVLDARVLETVRVANASFLALLARRQAVARGAPVYGLAPPLAARLAGLGAHLRDAVARCPYSLFNLRFEDAAFWRGIATRCVAGAPPARCALDEEADFARTAVFAAWHIAARGDLACSLAFGMTPAVQAAWGELPLTAIDLASGLALPQLRARWGAHAHYWPQLLAAAEQPSAECAERIRLLGLQLLAADGIRPMLATRQRPSELRGVPAR